MLSDYLLRSASEASTILPLIHSVAILVPVVSVKLVLPKLQELKLLLNVLKEELLKLHLLILKDNLITWPGEKLNSVLKMLKEDSVEPVSMDLI
jgi:hypothetical protein